MKLFLWRIIRKFLSWWFGEQRDALSASGVFSLSPGSEKTPSARSVPGECDLESLLQRTAGHFHSFVPERKTMASVKHGGRLQVGKSDLRIIEMFLYNKTENPDHGADLSE